MSFVKYLSCFVPFVWWTGDDDSKPRAVCDILYGKESKKNKIQKSQGVLISCLLQSPNPKPEHKEEPGALNIQEVTVSEERPKKVGHEKCFLV